MADPAAQRIWDSALGHMQVHVTRPNYDTWLKDTTGLRIEGGNFVVGVPTEFVREWLGTRMRSLVTQTLGSIIGRPTHVSFEIMGRNGNHSHNGNGDMPLTNGAGATAVVSSPSPRHKLNPKYTFDSFVIGDSNRMAAAAACAAAKQPGLSHNNPLFIFSAPGLGKTHLLQAVAQMAQPNVRTAYLTAEHFTNDFVTAISQGRADEFRRKYRTLQLLLVDDIQCLAAKDRTQEEFFYTFNDLHSEGCQLVFTSDRPPANIPGLEGRLCSRFQWGLIADIQPPDEETRLAILQAKAAEQSVDLPRDVAVFLANRSRNNIRELEGSLNRVTAFAGLLNAPITTSLATRALAPLTSTRPAPSDPQAVMKAVSGYFTVSLAQLSGKSRAKPIAEARHVAMFLLREDCELALKQIGLLLGHRDHSTVIHGVQKVSSAMSTDPRVAEHLSEIRSLISP
jgi:chromosomal replication initiator protein